MDMVPQTNILGDLGISSSEFLDLGKIELKGVRTHMKPKISKVSQYSKDVLAVQQDQFTGQFKKL